MIDQVLEKKLLIHILKNPVNALLAGERLSHDVFVWSTSATLFRAIVWWSRTYNTSPNTTELASVLAQFNVQAELANSVSVLFSELVLEVPDDSNIEFLCDSLLSYNKRNLVESALRKSVELLSDNKLEASVSVLKNDLNKIENKFRVEVIRSGTLDSDADRMIFEFHDRMAHPEKYKGIQYGYSAIDAVTGGQQKGTLAILAGRYKSGKSTFGLNTVYNIAKPDPSKNYEGKQVLVHCNEGNREFFQARFASLHLGIPLSHITKGLMTPEEQNTYITFYNEVKEGKHDWLKNIFFDEVPITASTANRIDQIIKKRQEETGKEISFVLCDYLGRMTPNEKQQNMAQWQALGVVSDELSGVAIQHKVAILALAHPTLAASKEAQEGNDINPEDLGLSSAPVKTCDYFFSWVIENFAEFERNGHKGFGRLSLKISRHSLPGSAILHADFSKMQIKEVDIGSNNLGQNNP